MADEFKTLGEQLREIFAEATRKAIEEAHAKGIPVSGKIGGKDVIVHPDGRIEEDDEKLWK